MTLWERYAEFTNSVSIYPDAGKKTGNAHCYVDLGLMNEVGELAGKVKKLLRDGNGDMQNYVSKGVPFLEAAKDELGDVAFYVMRGILERDLPINLWVLAEPDLEVTDLVPHRVPDLVGVVLQLAMNASEAIAMNTSLAYQEVIDELARVAFVLGTSLQAIVLSNIEKLSGRKERGTLQGEGDRR